MIGAAFPLARHILWLGDTHSNQVTQLQDRPLQRAHCGAKAHMLAPVRAGDSANFLHNTYTGQNGLFFSLNFRWFDKSKDLERAKGFEPSTPTLARLCSTPELRPLFVELPGRGAEASRELLE